jgi:hypothetical protein
MDVGIMRNQSRSRYLIFEPSSLTSNSWLLTTGL